MPPYLDLVFDIPGNARFTYRNIGQDPAHPPAPPKARSRRRAGENPAVFGKRVMAPFGKRELLGYIVGQREEAPPGLDPRSIRAVRRVVDKECTFGEEDLALAEWIAGYYLCGLGEALAAMIPSGRRQGTYPSFADEGEIAAAAPLELSAEQEAALQAVAAAGFRDPPREGRFPMFYLYGITGSGKTEVFLRAAEETVKRGKAVIYLVPEISLTHQAAEAIGSRFGPLAATVHSGMSPAARLSQWMRAREGELRIVVGPRSAVFTPLKDLGLVIIDEEHDGSYKSGSTPRYHARQTAMRRCAAAGAVLLMGSATPSAEAWKLMEEGRITRLNLSRRLAGGEPPKITAVSLEGAQGCLSAELKEEILATARMGRQSILFLNRRGFAYFYHCPSCGYELTCKHCSVSLTWHKDQGRALCHYCGYSQPPPRACPNCGSLEAGFRGFGTEMIEEEVRRTFPGLSIRRVDADSTGRKGSLEETLGLFRAGAVDILLGTQMVAKGLNFPGVRLVGVILADTGLQLPDFRAAERTFSLLVQVAGRAGRYFPDGKVIIQTLRMGDPVIEKSTTLDVEGFFRAEINQRRSLGFPPFTRLIRFSFRSRDPLRSDKAAARLASLARPLLPPGADILGPAECPIAVIAGNHRRHLILRGPDMGPLHSAAAAALLRYEKGKDGRVYVESDVDPVSLL
ncbi:MAG: primosomal protein N' [Treponema sp.]|jgi:primosomal protein N' (replication factor Y)|nr:primosomal protein N' [Treponema sp.]